MNPLYQKISEQILERIHSGDLSVGDRLPAEAEFAADIGVSRSTVRLAFAELESAGVLLRRKKIGTQIIAEKPQKRFSMPTTGLQELLSLGGDTSLCITGTRTVRSEDIPQLHSHTSETAGETDIWLEVSGTRTLADEAFPFSVNQVYVPARYAGIEPALTDNVTSVFRVIEKKFKVSVARVSQTVRAIACPTEEARILGINNSAPALLIDAALYDGEGELMEISVATFDPDRFQVHTEVKID